jgi:2-oxoisovalerate dehydrogenase E1 component
VSRQECRGTAKRGTAEPLFWSFRFDVCRSLWVWFTPVCVYPKTGLDGRVAASADGLRGRPPGPGEYEPQGSSVSDLFARDPRGKPIIPLGSASIYRFAALLRQVEQLLLRMFSRGLLSGTTHTCIGQELCQMAVVRALDRPDDVVVSNHRNHGHFLTYSGDILGLVGEVMGREAGVCGGIGGSQHLAYRHFHSNGVQAGMTAIAVGHALAVERRDSDAIVAVIIGDGTLGEGLLYESLNLASVWHLPVLFVVENNGIAQTTATSRTIGGTIEGRGTAFGLQTWRLDDTDTRFFLDAEEIVATVRRTRRPGLLVIDTRRLGPHSKGDDLRSEEEIRQISERDPVMCLRAGLAAEEADGIDRDIRQFVSAVENAALQSPEASHRLARCDIFRDGAAQDCSSSSAIEQGKTVRTAINDALRSLLADDPGVLLLGEDLDEPYGGAFKVTAGLATRFPGRVISTPISEAGIVGVGIGLAMDGLRPIVEIMFADFITLAFDQIYNHAVKFPGMFKDAGVPLVIRTPAGGRRGYGPTHSQSPENLLIGVPGLTVVFPSQRHAPGDALRRATVAWPYPVVFMEHKLLYGQTVDSGDYRVVPPDSADPAADLFPTLLRGSASADVTLVCYGNTVVLAEAAARLLAEEELNVAIVIPSLLSPLPRRTLTTALIDSSRIVVIEEAPSAGGFGAELAAILLTAGFRGQFDRIATPPVPIPAARSLEDRVLPSENDVLAAVVRMIVPGSDMRSDRKER